MTDEEPVDYVACEDCGIGNDNDPEVYRDGLCHKCGRERAEAALARVLEHWPHIEVQAGRYFTDKRTKDPGPPTCLRCKLEQLVAPPPSTEGTA